MANGLFSRLYEWASTSWPAAIFAMFAINLVALFKYWGPIMQRRNERLRDVATERDNFHHRLLNEIDRLDQRIKEIVEESERREALQLAENEKCRSDLAAVRDELAVERAERMKFERLLQGEGEIRQAAQNAASEIRLEKKDGK